MEFTHIKDCWNAVFKTKTITELKKTLSNLPIWSGTWEYIIYFTDGRPHVDVCNRWWDDDFGDYADNWNTLDDIFVFKKDILEYEDILFGDKNVELDKDEVMVPAYNYSYDLNGTNLTVYVVVRNDSGADSDEIRICTYEDCVCEEATDEGICDMIEDCILPQEGYDLVNC